jgi:chromosome condensin MukBEF complex kleisin-like MukF subunit
VIVRLMGEGQWRVDDAVRVRIDELDADTEGAVAAGDEQALQTALRALHDLVRASGEQLDHAHLGAPDAVVPPADLSLVEARELLHGEGLIPELP